MSPFFLAFMMLTAPQQDLFNVQSDLQALYDEINQDFLAILAPSDLDLLHAVRFTDDWTFVDVHGQRHTWSEMRQSVLDGLAGEEWSNEAIQKLVSFKDDTAVVLVNVTVVRKNASAGGQAPSKDAPGEIAETTIYRDTWIHAGDSWKLRMREQIGAPKTGPYKPYGS